MFSQNFDFNIRRDCQKSFLWGTRLSVGRRIEYIIGYVPKNGEKNSGGKGWKKMNIYKICFNPLPPSVTYMARLAKIFDVNFRRDHQKNFFERRAYESVDEKRLSYRLCPETRRKKVFIQKRGQFDKLANNLLLSNSL